MSSIRPEADLNRNYDSESGVQLLKIDKQECLNSNKDPMIDYDDIKNIAAAEFEISRDIAKIAIQLNPIRKSWMRSTHCIDNSGSRSRFLVNASVILLASLN